MKREEWLTDIIISYFTQALFNVAQHIHGLQFLFLDPQAINYAQDKKRCTTLQKWFSGFPLHEVHFIIWPIYFENHWSLSISNIEDRKVYYVDPYGPDQIRRGNRNLRQNILFALQNISKYYDDHYCIKNDWKFSCTKQIVKELNLLTQPKSNTFDCGVLVCIYIWAFVTGLQVEPSCNDCFDETMSSFRTFIGSMVHSWVFGDSG